MSCERPCPRSSCHTLHRPLMERQPYDTDLSDAEWNRIRLLHARASHRSAPPRNRACDPVCAARRLRRAEGRETSPSAGILDSQSVKTTAPPGLRGYDAGKKIKGRKRHLVVDTLGLPLRVVVHAADVQDRDSARQVLDRLQDDFPRLSVVWADEGYRGPKPGDWVKGQGAWQLDIVRRNTDAEGFEVLPKRWIVERTFAWLGRYRHPGKDYERRLGSSETWIHMALSRRMLKRLSRV